MKKSCCYKFYKNNAINIFIKVKLCVHFFYVDVIILVCRKLISTVTAIVSSQLSLQSIITLQFPDLSI